MLDPKRSKDHTPRAPVLSCNDLDLDGIGRRDSTGPHQIMIVERKAFQLQKRSASYSGDSYLCCGNKHFSGKGRQC